MFSVSASSGHTASCSPFYSVHPCFDLQRARRCTHDQRKTTDTPCLKSTASPVNMVNLCEGQTTADMFVICTVTPEWTNELKPRVVSGSAWGRQTGICSHLCWAFSVTARHWSNPSLGARTPAFHFLIIHNSFRAAPDYCGSIITCSAKEGRIKRTFKRPDLQDTQFTHALMLSTYTWKTRGEKAMSKVNTWWVYIAGSMLPCSCYLTFHNHLMSHTINSNKVVCSTGTRTNHVGHVQ